MEEVFAFPWGWGAKKDGGTAFSVFCPRENLVENEGIFFLTNQRPAGRNSNTSGTGLIRMSAQGLFRS